jgi:hypothetical protein
MMANLAAGVQGCVEVIEAALAKDIANCLQQLQPKIGTWEVVWGPAVYQAVNSKLADNAMFVARDGSDPPNYVVAIAGTNPYAAFDWLVEDAYVFKQFPWESGTVPPGLKPALAAGTHHGLTILQQLRPGPAMPGGSTTLPAFLQALPAGKVNLTVSGHSLGGALSPVTALWLVDTQTQWDPARRATVSCLPSAGPTPGNRDFAAYYTLSPLGARTTRIHNSIDVVPHAWALDDLAQVPSLYEPEIPADTTVKSLVFVAQLISADGHYAQINPDARALPGTVNTAIITSRGAFANFVVQLVYQHVDAYYTLLGIDARCAEMDQVREAAQLFGPQGSIAAFAKQVMRRALMAAATGK